MSNFRIVPPEAVTPRGGGRRRDVSFRGAAVEALEGRALLSHAAAARPRPPAADVLPAAPRPLPDPQPGPILNRIGVGYAYKSPRLYPFAESLRNVGSGTPAVGTGGFNGPAVLTRTTRSELNGAGAKAYLDGRGNLVLVGIVAGKITAQPKTADASEYYLWGIDRGLTPGPGPFPGRLGITFDALVAVAITPEGTSGVVQDLATGAVTPVSSDAITVDPSDVKVAFPQSWLLPAGPNPASPPTVNFFPATTFPLTSYRDVVSFTPEFRNFPISLRPIPHTGGHH